MQSFELYNYDIPKSLIIIYGFIYYRGWLNQRCFNAGQPSAMTVHHYLSIASTLSAVARRFIQINLLYT